MKIDKVFIFDTNALISAHLVVGSVSDQALIKALQLGEIGVSDSTLSEFVEVLYRKKLDRYFKGDQTRLNLVQKIEGYAVTFSTTEKITASEDSDDDMFLELAVASNAACIISGDPHLLNLHPFRGIPILSPADFLKIF